MLTAAADITPHAIVLRTRDAAVAAAVVRWFADHLDVPPRRVSVVLRLAPEAAGDLAAHRWAERLGVPGDRVSFTRWAASPDDDTVEAMIRVADPQAAATVAGWRDALLGQP
jgi:hypothetical protein